MFQNFEGEHHPPQEKFLLYVDGELNQKEAARWQSHLESCWSCRVRVGKIEQTIADIIEFEDSVSRFQNSRSSHGWGNFDSRLNALAQETRPKSRLWNYFKQLENFWSFSWTGKLATASFAALLIFTVFYQFVFVPPVSASELLEKATAARREQLKTANQPVIYQKLKVSTANKSAVFELWNEISAAKNKKSADLQADVLREYESAMIQNGFDPLKPLSAENYQLWRNRFVAKSETIAQTKTADGANAFELITVINQPREISEITQTSLIVREADWHPVSQSVQIKTESGDKTFEVSELEFRVLNRDALAADFFDNVVTTSEELASNPVPSPSALPDESPSPSPSAEEAPVETVKTETVSKVVATADLEIEVLLLLNQAKADLGEQITVKREADGLLYVRGIIETESRKNEILSALGSVKDNPAVQIEINTVAEAVAKEKNNPQKPVQVESVETQTSTFAVENDLVEHFGTQEAARQFARQTVNRSSRAMSRAYALKRLVEQFKSEKLRQLSPEARAKWLALIRSHAAVFKQETENLRGELQKVFDEPNTSASDWGNINDISSVPRAVQELLSLASANDGVVRSAMAVSAGNTRFTAIKTVQFWQSLKTAEALAAKLQRVK